MAERGNEMPTRVRGGEGPQTPERTEAPAHHGRPLPGDRGLRMPLIATGGSSEEFLSRSQVALDDVRRQLAALQFERETIQTENAAFVANQARQTEADIRELDANLEQASGENKDALSGQRLAASKRLDVLRRMQRSWNDQANVRSLIEMNGLSDVFSALSEGFRRVDEIKGNVAFLASEEKGLTDQIAQLAPIVAELHLAESGVRKPEHGETAADRLAKTMFEVRNRRALVEATLDGWRSAASEISRVGETILANEQDAVKNDASGADAWRAETGRALRKALREFLALRQAKPEVSPVAVAELMRDPEQALDVPLRREATVAALEESFLHGDAARVAAATEALRTDTRQPIALGESEAKTLLESSAFGQGSWPDALRTAIEPYRTRPWFAKLAPVYFASLAGGAWPEQSASAWSVGFPGLSKNERGLAAAYLADAARSMGKTADARLEGMFVAGAPLAPKDGTYRLGAFRRLEKRFSVSEITALYAHAFATFEGKDLEGDAEQTAKTIGLLSHRLAPVEAYLQEVGKERLRTFSGRGTDAKRGLARVSATFQSLFDDQLLAGRAAAPYLRLNYLLDRPIALPAWVTPTFGDAAQRQAVEEAKKEAARGQEMEIKLADILRSSKQTKTQYRTYREDEVPFVDAKILSAVIPLLGLGMDISAYLSPAIALTNASKEKYAPIHLRHHAKVEWRTWGTSAGMLLGKKSDIPNFYSELLRGLALLCVMADDLPLALMTAEAVSNPQDRDLVYVAVARAKADAGDLDGIFLVTEKISNEANRHVLRADSIANVAQKQMKAGDSAVAAATAQTIDKAFFNDTLGLFKSIALAESKAGHFASALTLAKNMGRRSSDDIHASVAKAMAQAGDSAGALAVAGDIANRDDREALMRDMGKITGATPGK